MVFVLISMLLAILIVKAYRAWPRRTVSNQWLRDNDRREWSSGVELPCWNWNAMRELAKDRPR